MPDAIVIRRRVAMAAALVLPFVACDGAEDECADGTATTSSITSEAGTFTGTAYVLPHRAMVHDVAIDPGGAVWYAAQSTACIGSLAPTTGAVHERRAARGDGNLHGLVRDAAGHGLWHGADAGFLTLLRPDGTTLRMRTAAGSRIHSVAMTGPIVWFTTERGSGFHDTQGGRTVIHSTPAAPYDIAAGPGGDVWFSMPDGAALGRYPRDHFDMPVIVDLPAEARPLRLAVDATGAAWFTDGPNSRIGVLEVGADSARWFALPAGAAFPRGIATTPDGHIWAYSESAGQIIRLDPAVGWIDSASIPVMGRHLLVDQQNGTLWVAGGAGLAAIDFAAAARPAR